MVSALKRIFCDAPGAKPSVPLRLEQPEAWNGDDAARLRKFLNSPTGTKLYDMLCYTAVTNALLPQRKDEFEQGVMFGRNTVLSELLGLSDRESWEQDS